MPQNLIQFQPGMSLDEFFARYGTEAQCAAAPGGVAVAAGVRLSPLRSHGAQSLSSRRTRLLAVFAVSHADLADVRDAV